MREVTHDDLRIRRFILGELKDVEREELEELFLTDGAFREKVLMAEDDLIDEYLDGELKGAELDEFRLAFQSTPQQSAKFRAARSIHNYAKREFAATQTKPVKRRPAVYVAIAASLLLAAMAALWLFNRTREDQLAADEQNRRMAVEKQLAEANAQSPDSPATISLVLAPVTTRSGNQASLSLSKGAETFELLLMPATTQFETFTASLTRLTSRDQYQIPDLGIRSTPGSRGVLLRLPAKLLAHGQYEIALQAIGPNGQRVDAGTFAFQVTD